jgi:NAD(P) transhydrogenase subunit alpha
MNISIPRETTPGENRVAATPDTVERLTELGYEVRVEHDAGAGARFDDASYRSAGATVVGDPDELWSGADIIIKIHAPRQLDEHGQHEANWLSEGAVLIGLIEPAQNEALVERLSARGATVIGLDTVPRLSRAQSVDVLSSMAAIAGYRAVVLAAERFGRFMGAQMTAAGSTPPAEVMVIGAGVAGLSAIATARGMGAQVKAFDVRPAVRQEVESLGGRFLELDFDDEGSEGEGGYANVMSEEFIDAEMALFREEVPASDIVITTAAIPGRDAPKLVLEDMVESMRAGSVIVDLAAASGGNCELTETGETIEHDGVTIVGQTNLASDLPAHASEYFGRNVANLMNMLGPASDFAVDEDDAVIRGMLILRDGELKWPPPRLDPATTPTDRKKAPPPDEPSTSPEPAEDAAKTSPGLATVIAIALATTLMVLVGLFAPVDFVQDFTVFVLACFVGWQVIWNVTPALHTPLMSVTNAISGIIVLGGILQVTTDASNIVLWLSAAAVLVAAINIFGGFLVTQRMLGMFRAEQKED